MPTNIKNKIDELITNKANTIHILLDRLRLVINYVKWFCDIRIRKKIARRALIEKA